MRFALIFSLLLLACLAAAQDFGPISTRNHRALDLPFLRFDIRGGLVPEGQTEWMYSYTGANDSRRLPLVGPAVVIEDQETERFLARYRKGLKNGMEFGVELPLLIRGGGFMDPIIFSWHQVVLRWEDPFRASQPDGQCIVQVPGSTYHSAAGIGDTSLFLSKPLNRRVDVGTGIKLPTGNAGGLLGSGGTDAGIATQYRQVMRDKWTFHAMLGWVAQSPGTALDSARGLVHQEAIALTWQPNSRDNWVVQWQSEASAVVTGNSGSDSSQRLVTFGYQRKLPKGRMLELSFSEDRDLFTGKWEEGANIGPDFTVHIGLIERR